MRYLGTIVTATHTAVDNKNTATPFAIDGYRSLILIPDQAITARTGSTGDAASDPATSGDYPISSGNSGPVCSGLPLDVPAGSSRLVSVYSTGGSTATVKVYGLFRSLNG